MEVTHFGHSCVLLDTGAVDDDLLGRAFSALEDVGVFDFDFLAIDGAITAEFKTARLLNGGKAHGADGGCHCRWICAPNSDSLLVYSMRIDTGRPAVSRAVPWVVYVGPATNWIPSR